MSRFSPRAFFLFFFFFCVCFDDFFLSDPDRFGDFPPPSVSLLSLSFDFPTFFGDSVAGTENLVFPLAAFSHRAAPSLVRPDPPFIPPFPPFSHEERGFFCPASKL